MTATREGKLSLRQVVREGWGVYRKHWTFLVPAAVVVLLPQSIADGFLEGSHVEHLRHLADFATLGAALLVVSGQPLRSGRLRRVDGGGGRRVARRPASAAPAHPASRDADPAARRAGPRGHPGRSDRIRLPHRSRAWSSSPTSRSRPSLLKLEHLGVQQALARSIQLVRGHARQVFVIAVGAIIAHRDRCPGGRHPVRRHPGADGGEPDRRGHPPADRGSRDRAGRDPTCSSCAARRRRPTAMARALVAGTGLTGRRQTGRPPRAARCESNLRRAGCPCLLVSCSPWRVPFWPRREGAASGRTAGLTP